MIKQIKKLIKNKWITVIYEDEATIYNTLSHLQNQNPNSLYYVQDSVLEKEKEHYGNI